MIQCILKQKCKVQQFFFYLVNLSFVLNQVGCMINHYRKKKDFYFGIMQKLYHIVKILNFLDRNKSGFELTCIELFLMLYTSELVNANALDVLKILKHITLGMYLKCLYHKCNKLFNLYTPLYMPFERCVCYVGNQTQFMSV